MDNPYPDRWDLEDTPATEATVLKIAKERYRGWRSTPRFMLLTYIAKSAILFAGAYEKDWQRK
uniref:Uncharacterized protein n=1 Tax=Aegilops tauschii subsp. strangulata TaxID=200361 RepID=A0A453QJS7_AEGTS